MNKKVLLVRRPIGIPIDSDFSVVTEPIPSSISAGEVLVKIQWASIDPAQRIWISKSKGYFPSVSLGEVVRAYGIGVIISSTINALKIGTYVSGLFNWQEYCKVDYREVYKLPFDESPIMYIGVLGLTGITAYIAVIELARPIGNEVVVISSAAGSVGSVACQIAKMKGCKVIGITGTDEKCEYLIKQLGIDVAINYKKENLSGKIAEECPKGIDVYIDNVGGEILDAVLPNIKKYARIILCGAISGYNSSKSPGIYNYPIMISMSATMIGFIVNDYINHFVTAIKTLTKWVNKGKIKYRTHLLNGLENAPKGLAMLFTGENKGKLIIEVDNQKEKI